jgi:TRAP-type mannitol/chloroaromatic compound transport system substrate-binding protein
MQRRSFLKHASLGAAAGGAALAAPAFAADAPSFKWRLASAFTEKQDALYGAAGAFAKYVSDATDGRFDIRPAPADDKAPASGVLDAVQKGTAEMGHAISSLYYETSPALCFDAAVPFGLNARQMNAWMFEGDGLKLTRDLFKGYGIVNFPLGNTGAQMAGWYRGEIKSIEAIKGLKMQASGLAGVVLARLGVALQSPAPADLAGAFDKGDLDAVEGLGPYDDEKLGTAPKAARFCYYPGWWAGSTQASLYIGAKAWESLPKTYRAVVEAASRAAHLGVTARYDSLNAGALRRLLAGGAQLRAVPRSVLDAAWDAASAEYAELSGKDPKFKALHDSYMGTRDELVPWFRVAEGAYDQYLASTLVFKKS